MTPNELDKLMGKYLAGTCSEDEIAFIHAWYKRLGTPVPNPSRKTLNRMASAEARIARHLGDYVGAGNDSERRSNHRSLIWTLSGMAASILLLIAAIFWISPLWGGAVEADNRADAVPAYRTVENESDSYKRVMLPDGSIVRLSPQSRVRFPSDNTSPSRELHLEGEAYFDIARNTARPFYVYAGEVITKVVGTSFIVRARGDDAEITVAVKTGKVTIYSRTEAHKKTVLVSNEAATYNRLTAVVARQTAETEEDEAEKQKLNLTEMHFEETPVPEVLHQLSKVYDISIDFDEGLLDNCVLTSSFYEEGLYDRIDVICTAIGATYHIVEGRIVIESKGCNRKQ